MKEIENRIENLKNDYDSLANINEVKQTVLNKVFPVGSFYLNNLIEYPINLVDPSFNLNPSARFGGKWTKDISSYINIDYNKVEESTNSQNQLNDYIPIPSKNFPFTLWRRYE